MTDTVLVTGASRGLGLEFVRQYAAAGCQVIAACRTPADAAELTELARDTQRVRIEDLDISAPASIDRLANRLRGLAIDILINNAGIMGAMPFAHHLHRQHFGSIDYDLWDDVFRTNTLGTVRMTEALIDNVAAGRLRKVISMSSTTGSITESRREALAYTTSKTALNKAMTIIAEQVRARQIIVTLICPGYVRTRMNIGGATLEARDSVKAMRSLIASLTLADSGTFRRYNGEKIAW